MFRTRDFILLFTSIVFLLVAISSTVFYQKSGNEPLPVEQVVLVAAEDKEYSAELYVPKTISREERLADMRLKIEESGSLFISSPVETKEEIVTAESLESIKPLATGLQLCSDYSEFTGDWPKKVEFSMSEGARIIFTESEKGEVVTSSRSSSTSYVGTELEREVLFQLPILTNAYSSVSCLSSDVVGVAKDGSLIKNDEAGLYGVFGAETIIGYALDGFPIYGTSLVDGDECGGQTVGGQYGYYLSPEKQEVLNCFAATPTKI